MEVFGHTINSLEKAFQIELDRIVSLYGLRSPVYCFVVESSHGFRMRISHANALSDSFQKWISIRGDTIEDISIVAQGMLDLFEEK